MILRDAPRHEACSTVQTCAWPALHTVILNSLHPRDSRRLQFPYGLEKRRSPRRLAPTVFRNRPFGQGVEDRLRCTSPHSLRLAPRLPLTMYARVRSRRSRRRGPSISGSSTASRELHGNLAPQRTVRPAAADDRAGCAPGETDDAAVSRRPGAWVELAGKVGGSMRLLGANVRQFHIHNMGACHACQLLD